MHVLINGDYLISSALIIKVNIRVLKYLEANHNGFEQGCMLGPILLSLRLWNIYVSLVTCLNSLELLTVSFTGHFNITMLDYPCVNNYDPRANKITQGDDPIVCLGVCVYVNNWVTASGTTVFRIPANM